ncbi:hypothetical protein ACFLSZ_06975 [Candidatus Bipolaricaulota bacterium]
MNDVTRLRLASRTPVLSTSLTFPGILLLVACVIACITTWPVAAQDELGVLRFMASGRVRIEVHDPEGNIVSRTENQIEDAIFQDDGDGMVIEIPHRVTGDYELFVFVDGSANPIWSFDLSVTDGVNTIMLADGELIVNAPSDPYVIRSSADGFSDVTAVAESESDGSDGISPTLIWILAGAAGLLVGIVLVFRVRRRKR